MIDVNFFIPLDSYLEYSLSRFELIIKNNPKKRVGSVTLEDLSSINNYPHGVYLLFDDANSLLYVGKATSRSFIERIPAHFDPREEAWFNTIPRYLKKFHALPDYQQARKMGLDLQILLIGVKETAVSKRLESVLRSYLKPKLNPGKLVCSPNEEMAEITNYYQSVIECYV